MGRTRGPRRPGKRSRLGVSKEIIDFVRANALPLGEGGSYMMRDRHLDKTILKRAAGVAAFARRKKIGAADIRIAMYQLAKSGAGSRRNTRALISSVGSRFKRKPRFYRRAMSGKRRGRRQRGF